MTRDLERLFRPRSIAVIGGGAWCRQAILQSQRMGYDGAIWPVHPNAEEVAGLPAYARLEDLPEAPDTAFIGINRNATIEAVEVLSLIGAGGAVCFASGFSEAQAEDTDGRSLQDRLVRAAGTMPILGPNCYGFINALDGALLWPDQHGCARVETGVAILTQSSNIAINLTMQRRSVPIAYTVTCGNMAQTSQAEIAMGLLDDPRITAIGLHVEGFGDLRAWEKLAQAAHARGVPLIALKVGRSSQAQAATVSHTASIAGGDAGAQAFLDRLSIPRVDDLPTFLETLKLLHVTGPLPSGAVSAVSCSGGEASLAADTALERDLVFPALTPDQTTQLRATLGPRVALANPLDYHTYIWRDTEAMARTFAAMATQGIGLTMLIVDYPHTDAADWQCATDAAIMAQARSGAQIAVVSTLPELMPGEVARQLLAGGVVPLQGLREAMGAAEAAKKGRIPASVPILLPGKTREASVLSESEAKNALSQHGLEIPRRVVAASPEEAAHAARPLTPPLVVKGLGMAHKSEVGAVRLNLPAEEIAAVAGQMSADGFLIEEMVQGGLVELLIGVNRDAAHGFVLTVAAGGVLTEIIADSASLLVPSDRETVRDAFLSLRVAPLIQGYRGARPAKMDAILDAVMALQSYVLANADAVEEVEINPLIATPHTAIAADALIRKAI